MLPSLRAKRSNPERHKQGLDCFVFAPRNDGKNTVIPKGAARLRGVSKDGRERLGHPSRLAEGGERLRMTAGWLAADL
jgi:hypothetical protein